MALARSNRLKKTRDIEKVLRRSERSESELFTLRVHWKASPPGRVAAVVSKKVSKKASVRVRLKRRAIEWLRTKAKIAELPLDCVLFIKPAAVSATKREFTADLLRTALKAKLHF